MGYWKKLYNSKGYVNINWGEQKNVHRTKNGNIVAKEIWGKTIDYIARVLELNAEDEVLELCCGNGLILRELFPKCKHATGVDFSETLLNQFKEWQGAEKIRLIFEDVKKSSFKDNSFTKVIIYFAIQYFTEKETIDLIEKCTQWIKPGGKLLIGDIPDDEKKWTYISKPEYRKDFIQRLRDDNPLIGHWFQKDFFLALGNYFTNIKVTILEQPAYQINANFRFDVLIEF